MIELWFIANLITGLAYLHIPCEIYQWLRGRDLRGLQYVGGLFLAFILSCGMHHLLMLRFVHHHPMDFWQVANDSVMAAVSSFTSYVLWKNRARITALMRKVFAT